MQNNLVLLEKRIGYEFKNRRWLVLALTHRSASAEHNERLEFLGDAVLGFMIADILCTRYPLAQEGELSRIRSSLVSRDALTDIAREFALGDYIQLGRGEFKSGGRQRDSILSCTVEALIGAIYVDSDCLTCQRVVLAWYSSRLDRLSSELSYKDAKTELQEWLQARHNSLPIYTLVKMSGKAHEQTFVVQCEIKELNIIVSAEGQSRRKAEKNAALMALRALYHGK